MPNDSEQETLSTRGAAASPVTVPALAAVAATTVMFLPQLAVDEGQVAELPAAAPWVWLVLLLAAAPLAAYVVARRRRDGRGAMALAGVPQVVLVVALIWLDVWLEVRSGYLLAGSGEEEMAYAFGTIFGALLGLLLTALVAAGAVLGSRAARNSR